MSLYMINESMKTDIVPEGYRKIRLNGKNVLRNLILKENGFSYNIKGKKMIKKSNQNSDGWIINNALIKLKGEKNYIKCSIFHEQGRKAGLYKLLDEELKFFEIIGIEEIEEFYLKNNLKSPEAEGMDFD